MNSLVLLAASAILMTSTPETTDYTTIPPDPYEVEQRLAATPVNAQEAVK